MALVSVVIPTLRRPKLVLRAINSVLDQTHKDIEVIVVVDGPDPDTEVSVGSVVDTRLRVIVNPMSLGAGGARNVGVDCARGEWIAFLDDDDEWLPQKLERQIAFACSCGPALVTCLSLVVTQTATYVWPQVIYDNFVPLDEYLFDRRSLFLGSSFIQTSSYLLPRRLLDKIRFKLPAELFNTAHDDWDFVLRLSKESGIRIETVPEVLVVHYTEEHRESLSKNGRWAASLNWLDSIRPIITPRAYSGFCLVVVGSQAAIEGAYPAFPKLLYLAFRLGRPTHRHIMLFLGLWLIPQALRRRLRALYHGQSSTIILAGRQPAPPPAPDSCR